MSGAGGLVDLDEWRHLTPDERRIYLEALSARGRAQLAQQLGEETAQRPALIVRSWQHFGLLGESDALATHAAGGGQ